MRRKEFADLLGTSILLFDGAYGTEFFKAGRGDVPGVLLSATEPALVRGLHARYAEAGADILLTNTFSANRMKLRELGLAERTAELNAAAVALALSAAKSVPNGVTGLARALVFGDISSSGSFPEPSGPASMAALIANFAEQASLLAEAGADGFLVETMSDLKELKAAILGIRSISDDLPIIAQMTFDARSRTLTGTSPSVFASVMNDLEVDVVGMNCSLDPFELLAPMRELAARSLRPISCEPNAGSPEMEDGALVYGMTAERFARATEEFADLGVNVYGGCCGTTPEHIAAVRKALGSRVPRKREVRAAQTLCSATREAALDSFVRIGERINPASRKKFQQELAEGRLDTLIAEAQAQRDAGAEVIDVNFGIEKLVSEDTVRRAINELQRAGAPPLCLDIQSPALLAAALEECAGRPLVNSSKADPVSVRSAAALLKRHGGMLILLALDGDVSPTAEGRIAVAEAALALLSREGVSGERVFVDPLALSIGTGADWRVTMEAIRHFAASGRKTVVGLSNLSFGMPDRAAINAAFTALAIDAGLSAAILDPCEPSVSAAARGASVLRHGRKRDEASDAELPPMVAALLRGRKKAANELLAAAPGADAGRELLKSAMETVGELYEAGKVFLPELLFAAEVSVPLFASLAPAGESAAQDGPMVLLATVEGDVHDIGKNIIKVVLESSGYRVRDLGKDVTADSIARAAIELRADFVGLSAMMTTTVGRIAEVRDRMDELGSPVPVVAGGASVNPDLATRYRVYYAKNGPECLELLRKIAGT